MKWLGQLRLSWVLMALVLVVSLVGANRIMHAPRHPGGQPAREPAGGGGDRPARPAARTSGVVATGVVVPETDIVPLAPSMKGEVVEVLVKTDDVVKKGQVLLRMDDRAARNDLARAENGVKNAEFLLKKAKEGLREWELKRDIQVKQIEIRQKQYTEAWETVQKLKGPAESKLTATAEIEHKIATSKAEQAYLAIEGEKKALELIDHKKPTGEIEQAEIALVDAQLLRDKAKIGVDICELRAPADGTIMQAFAVPGWRFGEQAVKPAFMFYQGGLIVKAEINQEWAHLVKKDQAAVIHDHTGNGQSWRGKVIYVARSFLPKREGSAIPGLIEQNQELVLECRIALDPDQPTPFLNQKVRVHLGQ